jgi:prepilin-type N-terminal cleavage/methylation domain-containing protein/prepilin-type processing-associated H-X9-DG protein
MRTRAFTLVELMVVVAMIALLTAVLLPALAKARRQALTVRDLANFKGLETAHWMYVNDYNGSLIRVGLAHGGSGADEPVAWINTLQKYYGKKLLHRSPVDRSPHWPVDEGGQGVPVPKSGGTQFRRTSYGVNNFLDPATAPWGGPYTKIEQIHRPWKIVHFVYMAETGEYAGADHPHVENWGGSRPPVMASRHLQINAHGGPPHDWNSVTNYGFLDGHAETLPFRSVFKDFKQNRFDPQLGR